MCKRFLFIFAACTAVFLASCKEEASVPAIRPGEAAVATTAAEDAKPNGSILIEDERITITSLEYWPAFNHDGNFSDNCLQFLRNFIENDADLFEFNSVQVSDWEIIRDPKIYGFDLAFNFTVTASELETLPAGNYKTIVKDAVDCYMTFSGKDPTEIIAPAKDSTEASAVVTDWLNTTYSWYMPDYKTAETVGCISYLSTRYADGEKMLYEDLAKLASEKLGIAVQKEDLKSYLTIESNRLYVSPFHIGGNTEFLITGEEKKGDYTAVTVQFYADCNGFILSDTVEYRIGDKEELLGCTVLRKAPYTPYGLRNAFQ